MKYLTLNDLGIITLIGAVMGLFTMLQLGFLNGGYRIFSEDHKNKSVVNDIIYSYFLVVAILVLIGVFSFFFLGKIKLLEFFYAVLATVFGTLLVFNNWIRNRHIAAKRVTEVNKLNLTSTLISFLFLFTVPNWGLYGALLVTFSIELTFFLLAIVRTKDLLPKRLNYNLKDYKWVLSFGFLPFLSGVIITYNMQVETWSIAYFISTEALGAFYLPRLYVSLFLLIPVAINQLYFPDAILAHKNHDYKKLRYILKRYFAVIILVCLALLLITILFISPVIGYFVPKHLFGVSYIWLILPGLMIYTILQPIDLLFYAANILRPFLFASIIGVSFTTIGLLSAGFLNSLSLELAAIIKSVFYVVTGTSILLFYFHHKKNIWNTVKP